MCSSFSCQYGERCRYMHVLQQPRKSNVQGFGGQSTSHQQQNTNPFGFGSRAGSGSGSHQQQKPNPFGFGMQNSSQINGSPQSEFKTNQFKVLTLFICISVYTCCEVLLSFFFFFFIVRHYNAQIYH